MAREHARILCSIWQPDDDFVERTPEAQRLFFLVISQREMNNAGVIPLMISKWARRSKHTTVADIEKPLAELIEHRYFVVDEATEELFVRSFMRRDEVLRHPYMRRSAMRFVEQIESPALRRAAAVELRRIGHPEGVATASLLDPDGSSTTHRDPIESGTSTTHRDAVESGTQTTHRDGIESGSKTTRGGRGGGRGRGSVPSVGGSDGGDARARNDPPPPEPNLDPNNPRCGRHRDIPATDPGPGCHACRAVRDQVATDTLGALADGSAARRAWRAVVEACGECDESGRLENPDGTPGPRHHPHPEDPS